MARTPDVAEVELILEEQTSDPSVAGRLRLVQDKGFVALVDGVVRGLGEDRENTWQPPVDALLVNTPPGAPATGYRVIIGSAPTGVFVGHAGEIAQWTGVAWVFTVPRQGTSAFVKGGEVPYQQQSAASPWVWDKLNPGGNFGSEVNHERNSLYSSTTSLLFVQKVRLSIVDLPLGNYFLIASAVTSGTNNNTAIGVQLELDDTTPGGEIEFRNSRAGSQWSYTFHEVLEAFSGSHTFDLDYRKASGGGSAGIESAQVSLWRIT